ncbi:MAG: DNA (cytosine-5-)-methyltransferase [Bacteroidota bacterium]|nr:DNA (cytosine-5-)-methyltransferase [Bacteroidota bacterium]
MAIKFIDLFAGLGGFHQALRQRGGQCVFASEVDPKLSSLYEKNFGIPPWGDIRKIRPSAIPDHDVLCAGFPCQPFSKAGDQKGLKCPQWGDLFSYVVRILEAKGPRYFIIENVPNLVRHNNGKTWDTICDQLRVDYNISFEKLSPHMFGIPQKRERTFIVGDRQGLKGFRWPLTDKMPDLSIRTVLDDSPKDALVLNKDHINYLETWQEFISAFPPDEDFPSFPIWAMEFGANYPVDGLTPYRRGYTKLGAFRGAFGQPLKNLSPGNVAEALPGYARTKRDTFPRWKINFIQKNRAFYTRYQELIDGWLNKVRVFPPSFQKLEWNCKDSERNIWKHLLQFRASGIRVRRTETAPSLIAMTTSQVPIIAWQKRYMTPRECSRLQSMGMLPNLPDSKGSAYRAFGNAVNVDVVLNIFDALVTRPNFGDRKAN